jgi:hypothetical protein
VIRLSNGGRIDFGSLENSIAGRGRRYRSGYDPMNADIRAHDSQCLTDPRARTFWTCTISSASVSGTYVNFNAPAEYAASLPLATLLAHRLRQPRLTVSIGRPLPIGALSIRSSDIPLFSGAIDSRSSAGFLLPPPETPASLSPSLRGGVFFFATHLRTSYRNLRRAAEAR